VSHDLPSSASAVIIGAGVIGCSTAYHLVQLGLSDVLILEREAAGAGSSGKSASMLSLQFGDDELLARMALYAFDRYMEFEAELGSPIDFKPRGWLTVGDEQAAAELRDRAARLSMLGITTDLLTASDVQRLYPELHYPELALGTYGPQDGPFDAHMILWGYLKAARRAGARLEEGLPATGIQIRNGHVESVETPAGSVATNVVINTAGPWAAEVGRMAGVDIPLANSNRTIAVTEPLDWLHPERPFLDVPGFGWYARPEMQGLLMGKGITPTTSLTPAVEPGMVEDIVEIGMCLLPQLEDARLQTAWTGVRPLTADGRPILGAAPELDGFYLNAGWGGVGIIQAPTAGRLLAELILYGEGKTFDLEPFSLERFTPKN
jgi:sarcosine oxidase subunit beta